MSSKDEKKEDPKIEAGDKSSGDSARKGTGSSNKGTSLIGRGNDRPPRRQAPYQQDAQRSRPTLDVFSFNLIHLWNVSNSLNWGQLRKTLAERFGRVKFIETFEAWTYKKIGHVIIEFETKKALDDFVNGIENENFLEAGVQFKTNTNRRKFFQHILAETGVDLMACKGVPPTFKWKAMKSSNLPPPVNPAEGWVTPQNSGGDGGYNAGGRRYGNNMQQQSYPNQQQQYVSSDAQMRARPLNAFQPTNSYNMQPMGMNMSPMAAPMYNQQPQQQQFGGGAVPWHSTPQQQTYGSFDQILQSNSYQQ